MKKSGTLILILFVIASVGFLAFKKIKANNMGKNEISKKIPDNKENKNTTITKNLKNYVKVYYFHTTGRCYSCKRIEELTKNTLETKFKKEIESKKVVFHEINTDLPENKHYLTDFKLYSKSVVVEKISDEKSENWKNLDKVWSLLKNDEQFQQYIFEEIDSFLKTL
ncbi:hypothetical protein JXR93_04150 [bacterium]|nr:hypothetical protein [bacterium]